MSQQFSSVFVVERRYDLTLITGEKVQICDFLNVFSSREHAEQFCQSAVFTDDDVPSDWVFAILECEVNPRIPETANRFLALLNKKGALIHL